MNVRSVFRQTRCSPTLPLVVVACLAIACSMGWATKAGATAIGIDNPGGTVTVGASTGGSGNGSPGGANGGGGAHGTGAGQNQWQCVSFKLVLNDSGGFAPGGPTPGSWYTVTCNDQATGASTTRTEWIPDQVVPSKVPAVNPYVVARQAENSLHLPAPTAHFDPVGSSVVNLATWLWIDADIWHRYAVTATVGAVSATAVATPTSVTWTMGNGDTTTCDGPGTVYGPAQSSTDCSYTYTTTSLGQPSADGNPDDGAYVVVPTVTWSVTWTATGAAGGGDLPSLSTSTSLAMRVTQVESLNSGTGVTTPGSAG